MREIAKLIILPAALWLTIQPVSAQDACETLRSARQTIPRGLYLIGDDQRPQALKSATIIPAELGATAIELAYKMPNRRHPRAGAVVVKIARHTDSNEETLPTDVRIVRAAYSRVCGVRDIRDFFFWNPERLPIDARVPLAEYIYYHKTSSDFDQIELHDFHLNYRDIKGVCTATDDTANGNRQQFLYGGQEDQVADNGLILEKLQDGLATAAQAAIPGSKEILEKLHLDRKLRSIIEKYRKLGQLETALYPYQVGTDCIAFSIDRGPHGNKTSVTLNDLERRDKHGRHLRIEQTWTFEFR
jgi:hypothetical protein